MLKWGTKGKTFLVWNISSKVIDLGNKKAAAQRMVTKSVYLEVKAYERSLVRMALGH